MFNHSLTTPIVVLLLLLSVLAQYSARKVLTNLARYFSHLNSVKVKKFNSITINICILVSRHCKGHAVYLQNEVKRLKGTRQEFYIFAMMSRME